MSQLQIQRCEGCGRMVFPDRLWCPGCGAGTLEHVAAGPGRVEQETTLRRPPTAEPVRIGTVRLQTGPMVIARLAADAQAGNQVRLESMPTGAIWAHTTPD